MIDSPQNLAVLGLSITSPPGVVSPQEEGAWLHLLGAPLSRVLLPRPPGLHIRGLRVPLGAALASSERDAYLWPETFVTTLAVGYHVVTPQQTRSGSFADFPSRWDTPRSCFEARGG